MEAPNPSAGWEKQCQEDYNGLLVTTSLAKK